ncbi:MAG: PAC2 family protein, partial [Candidatus Altiarchaeota archaeon]|nr:PAC2 family protein [Candidatus Altiarchaeota archaeon]
KSIPENSVVIEAFPSKGYVSTLAANQLIKQLDMELVGSIICSKLDAIAVIHEKKPLHPIRIYMKEDVVVVFSELIIPFNLTHEFTEALGSWVNSIKPRSAIFLASIPGVETDKEHEILTVSTDDVIRRKTEGLKIKQMDEGVLTGLSSSLMLNCVENNVPATSIMVETSYVPDVLAAASLLEIISKILEVDLDVKELQNAGDQIEDKFKEKLNQMKKGRDDLKEMHEDTMYR